MVSMLVFLLSLPICAVFVRWFCVEKNDVLKILNDIIVPSEEMLNT